MENESHGVDLFRNRGLLLRHRAVLHTCPASGAKIFADIAGSFFYFHFEVSR
jgi:hypothetical protein